MNRVRVPKLHKSARRKPAAVPVPHFGAGSRTERGGYERERYKGTRRAPRGYRPPEPLTAPVKAPAATPEPPTATYRNRQTKRYSAPLGTNHPTRQTGRQRFANVSADRQVEERVRYNMGEARASAANRQAQRPERGNPRGRFAGVSDSRVKAAEVDYEMRRRAEMAERRKEGRPGKGSPRKRFENEAADRTRELPTVKAKPAKKVQGRAQRPASRLRNPDADPAEPRRVRAADRHPQGSGHWFWTAGPTRTDGEGRRFGGEGGGLKR